MRNVERSLMPDNDPKGARVERAFYIRLPTNEEDVFGRVVLNYDEAAQCIATLDTGKRHTTDTMSFYPTRKSGGGVHTLCEDVGFDSLAFIPRSCIESMREQLGQFR